MKYLTYPIHMFTRMTAILCILFVWINYYLRNFSSAITISISIVIFIELVIYLLHKNKQLHTKVIANNKQIISSINISLIHSTLSTNLTYYSNILKTMYCSQKYKDCIVAIIDRKKVCVVPTYKPTSCNQNDIAKCIAIAVLHKADKLIVLSNTFDSTTTKYVQQIHGIEIELYDLELTYSTLLHSQELPQCPITISQPKLSYKDIFRIAFDRQRTKGYLMSGLILIISSLFVPYNIYYVVSGSILMLFALICSTKKRAN